MDLPFWKEPIQLNLILFSRKHQKKAWHFAGAEAHQQNHFVTAHIKRLDSMDNHGKYCLVCVNTLL